MENINIKQRVVMEALRDESFKKEFLKNPTKALQKKFKEWNLEWPKGCEAFAHTETPKELHFVVPDISGFGGKALNQEQLAKMAGGMCQNNTACDETLSTYESLCYTQPPCSVKTC